MKTARAIAAWAIPPLVLGLGAALIATDLHGWGRYLGARLFQAWQTLMPTLASSALAAPPDFVLPATIGALVVLGLAAIFLAWRTRLAWAGLFTAAAVAGGLYGSWLLYVTRHWDIDTATPGAVLIAVFLASALVRSILMAALRRRLRLAFSDSLPRAVIEKIARSPSTAVDRRREPHRHLSGLRRARIGGAGAPRSPTIPPAFTQMMQQVMTPLMDQALAHGGTIDRLTADGFAAFWNAPLDDPSMRCMPAKRRAACR